MKEKDGTLEKPLTFIKVYALATGATLSAGFFLLPGFAYSVAGPSIVIAYVLAGLLMIPGILCKVELATAMPRAGGTYYFLDRSLGPLAGTIGGIGTWLAMVLKACFALVGLSAYLALLVPSLIETLGASNVALILTLLFGLLNLFGAKKSGSFQVVLVLFLLILLAVFITVGLPEIKKENLLPLFELKHDNLVNTESSTYDNLLINIEQFLAATGLVFIAYVGATKVASVSEEVEDPEKVLPRGIFLSHLTSMVFYTLGILVIVGVISKGELSNFGGSGLPDATPASTAAKIIAPSMPNIASSILAIAALAGLFSVANASILSASRYPLAMARDKLMPKAFEKIDTSGTPRSGVLLTVGLILILLLILDPMKIAKLASAFQLIMFSLLALSILVMRESGLDSYDPGYRLPFYPWLPIIGIICPIVLIFYMGALAIIFSSVLILISAIWYFLYARSKVVRSGAIYHMFARLGKRRFDPLDIELREIMKEKGLRAEDPFDEVIAESEVVDLIPGKSFEDAITKASVLLSTRIKTLDKNEICNQLLEGTRIGATPVTGGVALPHLRLNNIENPYMVIIRSLDGINPPNYIENTKEQENKKINAIFVLLSPENNPALHLRLLAQLAGSVEREDFLPMWADARSAQEIREVLLRNERFVSLVLLENTPTEALINHDLRSPLLPENTLVVMIRRRGKMVVPKGNTTLKHGDRITILGEPKAIQTIRNQFEVREQ